MANIRYLHGADSGTCDQKKWQGLRRGATKQCQEPPRAYIRRGLLGGRAITVVFFGRIEQKRRSRDWRGVFFVRQSDSSWTCDVQPTSGAPTKNTQVFHPAGLPLSYDKGYVTTPKKDPKCPKARKLLRTLYDQEKSC